MQISLKSCLLKESLDTMNFLNEVVSQYPTAVSFAPGRPVERLFNVEESLSKAGLYIDHFSRKAGVSRASLFNSLGQYGKTNGLIQDLMAEYLAKDEGIDASPESIMITSGCQEAMAILLMGLFEPGQDVLMVSDPSYIGITGLAQILDVELWPIPAGERGLEPEALARAIDQISGLGKRPKAIYDIPDFNNPLGTSMPHNNRRRILEIARRREVLVFEDNPYGMFAFDGKPAPTLKSMDEHGSVIYLGTVSKTLFPGLRLGYLVADQTVQTPKGEFPVTRELSKIKSLLTVNTSPILQAVVGGILLEHECSFFSLLQPKIAFYKENRDHMLHALDRSLAEVGAPSGSVRWNTPGGGFFLTVQLPFAFDESSMRRCAERYGVICCPMTMFTLAGGRENEIRLSFSYVNKAQIDRGIQGLARFIADKAGWRK